MVSFHRYWVQNIRKVDRHSMNRDYDLVHQIQHHLMFCWTWVKAFHRHHMWDDHIICIEDIFNFSFRSKIGLDAWTAPATSFNRNVAVKTSVVHRKTLKHLQFFSLTEPTPKIFSTGPKFLCFHWFELCQSWIVEFHFQLWHYSSRWFVSNWLILYRIRQFDQLLCHRQSTLIV